jgi:hypothetical protein
LAASSLLTYELANNSDAGVTYSPAMFERADGDGWERVYRPEGASSGPLNTLAADESVRLTTSTDNVEPGAFRLVVLIRAEGQDYELIGAPFQVDGP